MRVAHLTTADVSLRYLVLPQLLAVTGAGGEAIGISGPGPFVPELAERGVRHIALDASTRGMDPLADLRAAVHLWRVLRRERPDVLHTHNPKPGLYGRVVGRLAGVPVIVNTVHGLYATPDDGWPRRLVVYGLEAVASRFSSAELVQNEEDLALLTRWRISPPAKTTLLGNGVDLARFAPLAPGETAAVRAEVRAELGLPGDAVVIGFVGRLVREKGLPELFEAAAALAGRAALVCIGPDDPDKPDAISRAEQAEALAAGVRFLGMRHDVDRLYRAMDVFVLPSHREGIPRSAMEAAACGVPVVATDVRGCRQVVDPGETGLLVPVRDPAALAVAIASLVADPAQRAAMGVAARRRAEACFDERDVVERVLAAYARAGAPAAGDPARRCRRSPVASRRKRLFDVTVAAVGLVALSPVLALVAALIRLRLGAPVLFRQLRPGHHGQPFKLVKFRSMRSAPGTDAERLTSLGRWLRATSLDELPELVNVLRGEMSLVGPRPLLVEYLERYSPEQGRRHDVRPGITGLAQVNGRNADTWDDRLARDVWYVDHWSFALDLKILRDTARQVLGREGICEAGEATRARFSGSVRTSPGAGAPDATPGPGSGISATIAPRRPRDDR